MTDANFSTLEAVNPGYEPLRNGKSVTADPGKQVVADQAGKEVITPYSDGMETSGQQYPAGGKDYHEPLVYEQQPRRSRKLWWIGGAILLVVVILGAVLGGVLGSRKSSKSSSSAPPSNTTTSDNNTLAYKVAAVASTSGKVNSTRLYFQRNDGTLVEATSSTTDANWGTTNIGQPGKNDSALAAAISRPGYPMEISVFYTDDKYLVHDLIYNSSSKKWNQGSIAQQKYITHPNSSLSAMYNQCRLCANTTIMTFQDINGFIQVANFTATGWTLSQLNVDPVVGTGLALQPFYRQNQTDQINLYHQKDTLNLSLASWTPASANDGVYAWRTDVQVYKKSPSGTPIAAASSYTNVTAGYESWIQLLKLTEKGVEVSTWSGNINKWLYYDNQPSALANSTANVKTYSSLAVTAIGSAFAVVENSGNFSIQSWQVNDNLYDWTSTGTVHTWK